MEPRKGKNFRLDLPVVNRGVCEHCGASEVAHAQTHRVLVIVSPGSLACELDTQADGERVTQLRIGSRIDDVLNIRLHC